MNLFEKCLHLGSKNEQHDSIFPSGVTEKDPPLGIFERGGGGGDSSWSDY